LKSQSRYAGEPDSEQQQQQQEGQLCAGERGAGIMRGEVGWWLECGGEGLKGPCVGVGVCVLERRCWCW